MSVGLPDPNEVFAPDAMSSCIVFEKMILSAIASGVESMAVGQGIRPVVLNLG